jgi:hypothetical protein
MNNFETIATVGLALGYLRSDGEVQIRIEDEWHRIYAVEVEAESMIGINDILLLLQAEEVA